MVETSSVDTNSSDMDELHDWLVKSVRRGKTFRSPHDGLNHIDTANDVSSDLELSTSDCDSTDASEIDYLDETDPLSATSRWCNSVDGYHKVNTVRGDGLTFLGDRKTIEEEDDYFPPGSSFDMTRPPSPTDIRDFPQVKFTNAVIPDDVSKSQDEARLEAMIENLIDDMSVDNLPNCSTVRVECDIQTIDIGPSVNVTRVSKLMLQDGVLIDTGANICMCRTSEKLVNVRSITPIPVGVAVEDERKVSYCHQIGYLPMRCEDGSYHHQPFLINPDASDMIMSPSSIVESNEDFHSWHQYGFKDDSDGYAKIMDKKGNVKLILKCVKKRGLYYYEYERLETAPSPIRTSISDATVAKLEENVELCDEEEYILRCNSLRYNLNLDPCNLDIENMDEPHPLTQNLQRPSRLPTLLPSLCENRPFEPILDPLAEIPFDTSEMYTVYKLKSPPPPKRTPIKRCPVDPRKQLESELWAARLGHCGEWQLDVLPACATGLPNQFDYHPLRFIEPKQMAYIRRQAARRKAERVNNIGQRFYADYGFMRASSTDYTRPSSKKDRIIQSYDGYNCYLAIVDEASRYTWIFLCKSKEPPVKEMSAFLKVFGLDEGGTIRCDQGGELASSHEFITRMQEDYGYAVEPTGSDSPSQNGGVERLNDTLAVTVRALLYGASLEPKFWSSALLHAAYLNNRKVHSVTKRTPFEGWFGRKPDLSNLRMFGSRVCVKTSKRKRDAKLDRNDFRGIFLGYTATDENIRYIDLDTGIVKTSHHAVFDECWYSHPNRPPSAQLLYDLGLVNEEDIITPPPLNPRATSAYPPMPDKAPTKPDNIKLQQARQVPLPLRLTELPTTIATRAASVKIREPTDPYAGTALASSNPEAVFVNEFGITRRDIEQVYVSPHPYHDAFEEEINLRDFNSDHHPTAGFKFKVMDERLIVAHIEPGTHGAKIPRWRSRLKGSWLRKVGDVEVKSLKEIQQAFKKLSDDGTKSCWLTFSHPEIKHGLTNEGIPQVNIDQLNPRMMFNDINLPTLPHSAKIRKEMDGDVLNMVTPYALARRLTRGKLLKSNDWDDWKNSEYKQLDQYYDQGMFGEPVPVDDYGAVFNLVWTYVVKELDKRKKARCTCDGSTRAGQVRVLDHTYANCVDQTSSRLFYALSAAENLVIYGADVSNAFAEAPPPKQGFYIRPDKAFHEWWTQHRKQPPIPKGYVIPVRSAMQGHPESPRLWEKHADKLLREIGLTPTVHEPCLYSGIIEGERVLFKRQVDDFAVAAPSERIANILFDMIDERITFPLKRMGLIDMFNGMDILQTRDYVKMSCKTYLERVLAKHIQNGLNVKLIPNKPTPLPTTGKFMESFMGAKGDPDEKTQRKLAKSMGFGYRQAIGEMIYAMVTCRPDLSFAVTSSSQHNACPAEIHFHGVKHMMKYAYVTRDDGIIFWRPEPNMDLPSVDPPQITSAGHDLMLDGRPTHDPLELNSYMDGTWASCLKTRRSFSGMCLRLAGGTVAYKCKLQPTVAQSSTESEFMAASDCGKMILYVRSILWDLGIPQLAATIAYEDNDACTAMANARKPTSRTRHIDIKYHVLCEWVERDLIKLERVDTSQNMSDHFTKQLGSTLFHRHVDYILGKVPPQYSSCYKRLKGMITKNSTETMKPRIKLPKAITKAPMAAAAAKLWTSWSRLLGTLDPMYGLV